MARVVGFFVYNINKIQVAPTDGMSRFGGRSLVSAPRPPPPWASGLVSSKMGYHLVVVDDRLNL